MIPEIGPQPNSNLEAALRKKYSTEHCLFLGTCDNVISCWEGREEVRNSRRGPDPINSLRFCEFLTFRCAPHCNSWRGLTQQQIITEL